MERTKEDLEKEKLQGEIKNLKRWWVQPFLSIVGLLIILITAFNTNISAFLKIKSFEIKEQKLSKDLDSTGRVLRCTLDTLKKMQTAFEISNRNMEDYQKRIKIAVDTIKTKDGLLLFYKKQLDVAMKSLSRKNILKRTGHFLLNEDGNILTTDDGIPIVVGSESGWAQYKAEEGDTIDSIANKLGVSVDDLLSENPELKKHGLSVGMILNFFVSRP
ncbi:MAG: LysM peptidoglycan-binding domain-containing protein [Bacteroidetes bacterium]|nr:LysM peptidoglycan-binding domain-containing protein [Bacteroidota bacterium]